MFSEDKRKAESHRYNVPYGSPAENVTPVLPEFVLDDVAMKYNYFRFRLDLAFQLDVLVRSR